MMIRAPLAALAAWRKMAIANKITVLLTIIAIAGMLAGGLALSMTIKPAFDRLEEDTVARRGNMASRYLESLLAKVEGTAGDYGVWDDSYDYLARKNRTFVEESLTGLGNVGVSGVAYVRFDRGLLHAQYVDLESGESDPALTESVAAIAADPWVLAQARSQARFGYFAHIGDQLVAVGVARVVRSDGSGEPKGFVLMTSAVSDTDATDALQMPVTIGAAPLPSEEVAVRADQTWRVIVPASGSEGRAVASLRFEVPREISQLGQSSLVGAFAAGSAVILAMLFLVGAMITQVVAKRLAGIERHIQRVAGTGELEPLAGDPNSDELGSLALSFNKMIAQLKDLREQVQIQSYKLGRGEWAAGVMHNVRNALNPVTVIMSKVASQKSAVESDDLLRAARELANDDIPAVRRQALLAFLVAAFEEGDRSAAARRTDLISARSLLSEAIKILSDQHKVAHEEIPTEAVDLLELVEHNAALVRFVPWGEVSTELPATSAQVSANRLLLSQVIGNLLTNSVEAIVAAERRPGLIKVAIRTLPGADGDKVELRITDDGVGFCPERAEKLFMRGESSKKTGSGGLGLHWCANTMTAMNGKLALTSEGPGLGATATLTLAASSRTGAQFTHLMRDAAA
jgi:signal transduction histidine kinase